MRILVLGGTVFVGRHFVQAALARGHSITLFHRGKHGPDMFPEVERILGDRGVDSDLARLDGRTWDAVLDTSGYVPRIVRASAERLAPAAGYYLFVSTISVYGSVTKPGIDESAPVATIADPSVEEITGETYGPLKALCEQAVEAAMPGRVLNVRPGLIVGPDDLTDRFTYWPVRVARGGEVLAPGRPGRRIQVIDVRDLAEWMLRATEAGTTGVMNATGPVPPVTMADVLETSREVSGSDAQFMWVDEDFLLEREVAPWTELPAWVPEKGEDAGLFDVDVRRAVAAGLTFRPMRETVRATLEYARSLPADHRWRAGLAPEKEREVLAAWAAREG